MPEKTHSQTLVAASAARYEVLVAGAGPAGLMLALMARQAGLNVAVIEATEAIDARPRAVMIHARGMEILKSVGLDDRFLKRGLWQKVIAFEREDGLRLAMNFGQLPSQFSGFLNIRQPEIESILIEAFLDSGGVIYRGMTVNGFLQADDRIIASVSSKDGTTKNFETAWLFGCDGARSTIRESLDSEFTGETLPYLYILGEGSPIKPWSQGSVSSMLITENGVVSWLPFLDGEIRIAGPGHADIHVNISAELPTLSANDFLIKQSRLVSNEELRIGSVKRSAYYKVHSRIASKWGERRVWLAGDAAHVHPPAGGQALNLGWSDAEAIALRLSGSLDFSSYQDERKGVAEATLAHVAMMSLINAIRQIKNDAQLETAHKTLQGMALRFSHLSIDYSSEGLDRLGSLNPETRRELKVGRRVDSNHALLGDAPEADGRWVSKAEDFHVWLTADRHVRRIEALA
jgi:2-polyprenyl-6-methoxyphenol hydroxylase-like FAD-dependent oxidoreductase